MLFDYRQMQGKLEWDILRVIYAGFDQLIEILRYVSYFLGRYRAHFSTSRAASTTASENVG